MKPKLPLILALIIDIVFAKIVVAQDFSGSARPSLETRILQAPTVISGTITNFSPITNRPSGIAGYAVTVRVDEVLKGRMPPGPFKFDIVGGYLERWAGQASFLWFLDASGKFIKDGDFMEGNNIVFLGSPNYKGYPDFWKEVDMDLTVLTNSSDILSRARTYAAKHIDAAQFHAFRWAESGQPGDYVILPVEPSLEKTAKHLITAPQDYNDWSSGKKKP